jgi:hypothetical protein
MKKSPASDLLLLLLLLRLPQKQKMARAPRTRPMIAQPIHMPAAAPADMPVDCSGRGESELYESNPQVGVAVAVSVTDKAVASTAVVLDKWLS